MRDIPIPKLHAGDVTLIIGTDFPKLLLNQEYKEGKHFEPYAIKTCGNKRLNTSVNSILTQTFHAERFWEIENYGTVPKQEDCMKKGLLIFYRTLFKELHLKKESTKVGSYGRRIE